MNRRMIALIGRESDGYVLFCPELDIAASQGSNVHEARENLR